MIETFTFNKYAYLCIRILCTNRQDMGQLNRHI